MLSRQLGGNTEDTENNRHPLLIPQYQDKDDTSSALTSITGDAIDRVSGLSFSSFSGLHPTNGPHLTTFLLLNTMIGSGILNQPYVFSQSGIAGGLFGFLVAGIGTWFGLVCLTAAGLHVNILEYSGLANFAFKQHGERIVDISIIIVTFGAQLGYILIVGTTLSDLLGSWGCESIVCNETFTTIVSVGVFVMPVCMFRTFGHLAYLSLFSIAAIVAVLVLVIIGGPIKHQLNHTSNNYEVFSFTGMLQSTGSIIFSLSCASANFQAYISTEKTSRNLDAWRGITGRAVLTGTVMCSVMGLVGYLSFGDDTSGMILDNFPQHAFDFFKVMVVTHLILYIPVNFVIMRYSLVRICTGRKSEHLDFFTHTVLTAAMLVGITALVLMLLGLGLASGEAFSLILNITGGIGGSLATLIIPAVLYLKVLGRESPWFYSAVGLAVFGTFIMFAVLIVTILEYV